MPIRSGGSSRLRRAASECLDEEAAEALAQRLLAASERSLAEVRQRLMRAGARPEVAFRVAARAAARGWVDDGRLADSLVQRSLERGYGRHRLLADLRARGVDRGTVEEAMQAVAAHQEEAVSRAAERLVGRRPAGPLDPAEARRLAAALLRRGFGGTEVRDVVRRLARGEGAAPPATRSGG